jgi:hypothetical protein
VGFVFGEYPVVGSRQANLPKKVAQKRSSLGRISRERGFQVANQPVITG